MTDGRLRPIENAQPVAVPSAAPPANPGVEGS